MTRANARSPFRTKTVPSGAFQNASSPSGSTVSLDASTLRSSAMLTRSAKVWTARTTLGSAVAENVQIVPASPDSAMVWPVAVVASAAVTRLTRRADRARACTDGRRRRRCGYGGRCRDDGGAAFVGTPPPELAPHAATVRSTIIAAAMLGACSRTARRAEVGTVMAAPRSRAGTAAASGAAAVARNSDAARKRATHQAGPTGRTTRSGRRRSTESPDFLCRPIAVSTAEASARGAGRQRVWVLAIEVARRGAPTSRRVLGHPALRAGHGRLGRTGRIIVAGTRPCHVAVPSGDYGPAISTRADATARTTAGEVRYIQKRPRCSSSSRPTVRRTRRCSDTLAGARLVSATRSPAARGRSRHARRRVSRAG